MRERGKEIENLINDIMPTLINGLGSKQCVFLLLSLVANNPSRL